MREIELSLRADRAQRKLPAKHRQQIARKILSLKEDVHPAGSKQLKGYQGLWRIRSGDYRIIYRYDEHTIFVELIGKRNDDEIYKMLKKI